MAKPIDAQCPILIAIQDERLRARVAHALTQRGVPWLVFDNMDTLWSARLAQLPAAAIVDSANPALIVRKLADFLPSLPILVLTGYASSARVLPLLTLGNVRIRQKPLDTDEMMRALAWGDSGRGGEDAPAHTIVRTSAEGVP